MAKTNPSDKPEPKDKAEKKAATKEAAVAAAQATTPLRVEVHFPAITDLKQGIGFDADGNLIIQLQFKARVDQYEIFRLVNLLKQPHGTLFANIGSPQSAMDFRFTKEGKMEILKSELAAAKPKPALTAGQPQEKKDEKAGPETQAAAEITFKDISFNHLEAEEKPFGVVIDFTDGAGDKPHVVAGRGKTATEAVVTGVKQTSPNIFGALEQPFEIVAAVKKTPETDAQLKIIRAIEVGSFDIDETKPPKPEDEKDK